MKVVLTEAVWLDGHGALTLVELAECSGLSAAELREMVDLGALAPIDPDAPELAFGSRCIVAARTACRLRRDFELDAHALAVVLTLLDRVEDLEAEVRHLRANLPRRLHQ